MNSEATHGEDESVENRVAAETSVTENVAQRSRSLTDSPWFWLHLFCVAGLVAIFLMQPKYGPRQSQLERQFQGREHSAKGLADQESKQVYSSNKQTVITLTPLFWLLVAAVVGSWGMLWWTHFRRSNLQAEPSP